MRRQKGTPVIERFDLEPGLHIGSKYEVVGLLGRGWEGEVYLIREQATGIERAAKFFFPHRNPRDRASLFYARKLFRLRHCPILIQYHTQEKVWFGSTVVTMLVSDFVEGEPLGRFLAHQPGRRLGVFEGLHLLHALAVGIEPIHNAREYHGDIHDGNVVIKPYGVGYELKLVDMFHWGPSRPNNIHDDVCDMVRVFYDAVGGAPFYKKHPPQVRDICNGLRRSLILRKFRSAGQLRQFLETLAWD